MFWEDTQIALGMGHSQEGWGRAAFCNLKKTPFKIQIW